MYVLKMEAMAAASDPELHGDFEAFPEIDDSRDPLAASSAAPRPTATAGTAPDTLGLEYGEFREAPASQIDSEAKEHEHMQCIGRAKI